MKKVIVTHPYEAYKQICVHEHINYFAELLYGLDETVKSSHMPEFPVPSVILLHIAANVAHILQSADGKLTDKVWRKRPFESTERSLKAIRIWSRHLQGRLRVTGVPSFGLLWKAWPATRYSRTGGGNDED